MAATESMLSPQGQMDRIDPLVDAPTPSRKISANKQSDEIIVWDDPPSSPFMTDVGDASRQISVRWGQQTVDPEIDAIFGDVDEKENAAPTPANANTISKPATPQKRDAEMPPPSTAVREKDTAAMPPSSTTKRTKSSSPEKTLSSRTRQVASTPLYTRSERAIPFSAKSFTARDTSTNYDDFSMVQDETNIDDTCFSTFSAVPEMTVFAKLGDNRESPSKFQQTPRQSDQMTSRTSHERERAGESRSPSPTPRRQRSPTKDGNTTSLLLDFTQQMEGLNSTQRSSPSRAGRLSPSRTAPNLLSYINNQRSPARGRQSMSPAKQSNLLNLLDFELPPPPTPRSTPAFSVREVESLKSSFQSQISSIKAKLSGKEAEVDSLKKALEDAERRVGEAQEAARDEKMKREQAEQEKADWEKRGLDVEKVLQTVKEEVLKSEAERETLERRAEDSERRASDTEARNLDLQARLATLPARENGEAGVTGEEIQRLVQAQLDAKIEGVSRELHTVYKKKHETKVATLKKSYEARSEKRTAELETRVDELMKQNEDLLSAKEATFSGEIPVGHVSAEEYTQARQTVDRYRAEIEEQNARFAGLNQEILAMKSEHSRISQELESERAEKGELVAAVDEMLTLQADNAAPAVIEDFRKSISRASGLKPPTSLAGSAAESRIGRGAAPGLVRAGSSKSKMMSNIERMGGAARGL